MKRISLIFLGCAALVLAAAQYQQVAKYQLGGEGSWDYLTLDQASHRLYVSHSAQLHVLDSVSGAVIGSVPAQGMHGIALATEFGRGYISNGGADNAEVVDLATLKVVGEIPTGKKPDAVLYDPATKQVFVNNGDSESSTVIRASDGKVAGTVALGGAPEASVSDGKGMVYTNLEEKSEIVKIDARQLKVVARWKVAPCEAPAALAMDAGSRRLFAGCRNKMMAMVDADTGKVVTTRPIGDHVDAAVFAADLKLLYLSNGDGTVNIFRLDSPSTVTPVETVRTQAGAKTMALDGKTHRIYVSTADYEPGGGRKVKPGSFKVLVYGN